MPFQHKGNRKGKSLKITRSKEGSKTNVAVENLTIMPVIMDVLFTNASEVAKNVGPM